MKHLNDDAETHDAVDADRRAAIRKLGALAGAAPAVVMLLAPSSARAEFRGGSCLDTDCDDLGDIDNDQDNGPQI